MIAAPFTMVLLAAFMTEVGALQTAPILIAVITAFLAMEGVQTSSPTVTTARTEPTANRVGSLSVLSGRLGIAVLALQDYPSGVMLDDVDRRRVRADGFSGGCHVEA